jgi:hypothetical protein
MYKGSNLPIARKTVLVAVFIGDKSGQALFFNMNRLKIPNIYIIALKIYSSI